LEPIETTFKEEEYPMKAGMSCLEDENSSYSLNPGVDEKIGGWSIFAYDESMQEYQALEGSLLFCSSAIVRVAQRYEFNLTVLPYFITSMRKFKDEGSDEIRYSEELTKERNMIMVDAKRQTILENIEPHSLVLIDGPLIGRMASYYIREMDTAIREKDCIPLYFVKNSDSRLVLTHSHNDQLANEFNSDFHWATYNLKERSRSAFFKYTDLENPSNIKIFTYMKTLAGFAERIEMHPRTFQRYASLIPSVMNLLSYLYIVQGDFQNPQVRPIAVAEKFAREGIRLLNIPTLLWRLGFHPTVNQARFG
jgi:hypothetical protein